MAFPRALARRLGIFALLALMAPAAASAHVRTGIVAVDYRASVFPLPPVLQAALAARVYRGDQALGITVHTGHTVVVFGYAGEPFLRVTPAGVAVNASSPTAAATGLLRALSSARTARGWHPVSRGRGAVWHDARVRGLPPGLRQRRWAVPLAVDGRRSLLEGEISRVAAPAPWPWLGLGVPFVVAATLLLLRKRSLLRSAALVFGLVAATGTVATAAAFALAPSASVGKWIEGANELVFAVVGMTVLVRGSADARAIAGGALGLLGLWAGLSKMPVFLHGIVLSALSGPSSRALVALTVSASVAATAAGLAVFFELLEPRRDSSYRLGRLEPPP